MILKHVLAAGVFIFIIYIMYLHFAEPELFIIGNEDSFEINCTPAPFTQDEPKMIVDGRECRIISAPPLNGTGLKEKNIFIYYAFKYQLIIFLVCILISILLWKTLKGKTTGDNTEG